MHIRGASASSGLISAACINLLEDIHYKPENMYCAGIISGPKEPTLEFLNPYLKPVIDDMVIAWERGYHFSQTPFSLRGRTSRCAIAAVVADLVAARKTAQLGPGTHTIFCVACKCTHRSSLGRVDCDAWEKHSGAELQTIANQWKTASTTKEQSEIYKAHGVHWSELWRLPYWDPVCQLVVDPMHCILEGLAQQHSREVLDLTTKAAEAKPEVIPAFTHEFNKPDARTMNKRQMVGVTNIQALLMAPIDVAEDSSKLDASLEALRGKLTKKTVFCLQFVATELDGSIPSGKRMLKKRLGGTTYDMGECTSV
ncbi:hypothetical protein K439DRAFT_1333088 [Ramaria rubella]|nr:hypothetical protein K439DRAFT_1333088 [Ramaria rubella]